jgi:hypothetical protein
MFMGVLILDACESGMPQFDKRDEAVTGSQGAAHCAQKKRRRSRLRRRIEVMESMAG